MTDDQEEQLIDVTGLSTRLRLIVENREWQLFHTSKNPAMVASREVGELLAEMQWLAEEQILDHAEFDGLHQRIVGKLSDVLIYLVYLADTLSTDLN